jgi:hypothetical protein
MPTPAVLLVVAVVFGQSAPTPPAASPLTPRTAPAAIPLAPTPPPAAAKTPAAPPAAPAPENLKSFDTLGVDLSWSAHGWELMAADKVLKDFGRREADARQALRTIRELHLTQYGTIGTPYPVMEYWLSDGQAPSALVTGLRTMALDPMSLKVEQVRGQWCLRDGQRVLFNFGGHEIDARDGLDVLKKYGFTQVATIGQGGATMLVFLGQTGHEPHTPLVSRQHHPTAHPEQGSTAKTTPQTPSPLDLPVVTPALPPLHQPEAPITRAHADPLTQRAESHAPHAPSPYPLPHCGGEGRVRGPGEVGERVPFDWRQLQLRYEQGVWKLQSGSMVFARFGNDNEAHQALRAMQYYRVNEERRVGEGGAAYFLSSGQAPRGLMFGLTSLPIQPEQLSVRQVGDRWAVCNGDLPLLRYGSSPDEARRMLDAIRQYHFDHLCHFGADGGAGLTLLVKTR